MIVDGRTLAAALLLGAHAASLGTRFIATPEANAHPEYKRRISNRVVEEWRGRDERTSPQPEPAECIGTIPLGGAEYRMSKFSCMLPTAEATGDLCPDARRHTGGRRRARARRRPSRCSASVRRVGPDRSLVNALTVARAPRS